ncbi:MAG: tetratricopeptide repeat protein [Myxococcales bacterium]|nr:tetratricopeptide repeat protein [Myxococcales bacterium]
MDQDLDTVIRRGLDAVDAGDIQTALDAVDEAAKHVGENHVRVLHLNGMIAWAEGRVENAAGYLMQAVDLGSELPEIYLDCAECLFIHGDDLDEAEAVVRALLERDGVEEAARDEGRLLLAQIRLDDDDPDEALELLERVTPDMQGHPAYLSTYGAVMLASGRGDEAVKALEKAVAAAPEDPDFHYQLGLTREAVGDREGAAAAMLKVLELDSAAAEAAAAEEAEAGEEPVELTDVVKRELVRAFEEVLEEIPDKVLRLLAEAPVSVQRRATPAQVRGGVNPRVAVAFVGAPKTDDAEAELEGIVIMYDLLMIMIDDDDEIPEVFIVGIIDELRRFFDEALGVASVEG